MDTIVQTPIRTTSQQHLPFVLLGVAVAVVGFIELWLAQSFMFGTRTVVLGPLVVLAFGIAVALSRVLPGAALGIVWAVGILQLVGGFPVLFVQASVVVVAFACARWGSIAVQWISGLSIPLIVLLIGLTGTQLLGRIVDLLGFNGIVDVVLRAGLPWRVLMALAGLAVLGLPWLTGFVLRAVARVRVSEASTAEAREEVARVTLEAQQAAEIARLQEERSQLALDVHDVVGHSLAVILAQAESAQYLPDDPARLKQTIATIAGSARTSLQDVRHVLGGEGPAPRRLEVDVLLESARAAGFTVEDAEAGEPHPLPPELQTVAHRVLQEMITNAIRHGRRTSPIRVSRRWPEPGEGQLVIEVSNAIEGALGELDREGAQGVAGMRRRLESVGGSLELAPPARKGGRFVAVATLPVRPRAAVEAADG